MSDKDYVARVQSVAALQEMLNKKYYQQIADELSKTQKMSISADAVKNNIKKISQTYGIPEEVMTYDEVDKILIKSQKSWAFVVTRPQKKWLI